MSTLWAGVQAGRGWRPSGSQGRPMGHLQNRFSRCFGNSAHIYGTRVPVEEPSTASKGDITQTLVCARLPEASLC
jgi:hypothetical protein